MENQMDHLSKIEFIKTVEPLYDTDVLDPRNQGQNIVFFQRPYSQTMCDGLTSKTEAHTNLNQCSMLDYPCRFDATGIGVFIDELAHELDLHEIISNGCIQIIKSGRRPIFQCALSIIPRMKMALDDVSKSILETTPLPIVENGMAYRIEPGEAFNVKLFFSRRLSIHRPIRIAVALYGVKHVPDDVKNLVRLETPK